MFWGALPFGLRLHFPTRVGSPRELGSPDEPKRHVHVVDSASLQFANPLHAHCILHLCGYSSKRDLCLKVLASGAFRAVRMDAAALQVSGPLVARTAVALNRTC